MFGSAYLDLACIIFPGTRRRLGYFTLWGFTEQHV